MLLSLHDIGEFLKEYIDFYKIKPHFKCKLAFFSGTAREVELEWLSSLHLAFKYIRGDNTKNYNQTMKELEVNRVIFFLAKQSKLLHRTSLPKNGYAFVHIIFDKAYTPFDNCIDIKLLLYEYIEPLGKRKQSIFDDLSRLELEALLYEIHKKGYVLNKIYIGQKTDSDTSLVLANFNSLSWCSDSKTKDIEYHKFQKLLNKIYKDNSCLGAICGCVSF